LANSRFTQTRFVVRLHDPHLVFICLIPHSWTFTPIFLSHFSIKSGIISFNCSRYHSVITLPSGGHKTRCRCFMSFLTTSVVISSTDILCMDNQLTCGFGVLENYKEIPKKKKDARKGKYQDEE